VTRSWRLWRGSVKLLLHVARCAADSVAEKTGETDVPVSLVVAVDGDEERFTSIDDFRKLVSPEALRDFGEIRFTIGAESSLRVKITFRRRGEGAVHLLVEADNASIREESIEDVGAKVGAAIDRGGHKWDAALRSPWGLRLSIVGVIGASAVMSALFRTSFPFWLLIGLAPATVYGLVMVLLLPQVEVAPRGRSRVELFGGAVITIALGLVVAGIAKRLFG
jgi:hypothetical protein